MFNQRGCRDAGRVGGRLPQVRQLLPPHGITLPLSIRSASTMKTALLTWIRYSINWGTQWLKKSTTGRQHQRWGGVYWLCSICGTLPKYLAGFNKCHCFPWYIRSTVGKQAEKISGSNFSHVITLVERLWCRTQVRRCVTQWWARPWLTSARCCVCNHAFSSSW